MRIPLGLSSFDRSVAETPEIRVLNRYFEQDPTNQKDQIALLCRPGLRKWLTVGDGPSRGIYAQPGTFGEAIFDVSGTDLYRIDQDETPTNIGSLDSTTGAVSMAATDTYLFLADGLALWYYADNTPATGTLTSTGAIANNDVVRIGDVYYKFTNASVDAGTPAGTSGSPWLVALGASVTEALAHLATAIEASSIAGAYYSSALTAHTLVMVNSNDATTLVISALLNGTGGNAIVTTETGANIGWGGGTLAGGGGTVFDTVDVPDDDGIVSVGVIASFTICVVAQAQDKNGRFYWIDPGDITIDPLNFATAERSPDPVWNVVVAGDQFWLPGSSTIEVWYPTGDPLAPFLRQQGRLFERGAWEGTVVQIRESMMLVDSAGEVWEVTGSPKKASTPGVAQRLRVAINAQRAA